MKYLVACNWDLSLLDQVDFPEVASFFGGLPDAPISSGRPSSQIRPVSETNVRKFIQRVHEQGRMFDYNVNSSCLANKELTGKGFKAIMRYLERVADLGVDALTITNTNLIGVVKRNFPKLKINLSTFQKVTEVAQARRYEDLGVDLIMLSEHVNRDFKTLQAIRNAVKCQLALIANVGCIYDCPNAVTHANSIAHSGAKGEARLFADPFMLYCIGKRLSNPEELVKIRWIRPEDVGAYEDVGIDVLKIVERNSTTEALVERVTAYCGRSYDGNLLRLLGQMIDTKRTEGRSKQLHFRRMLMRPSPKSLLAAKKAKEYGELFSHPLYELASLDNKKLPDNFIQSFAARDCRATDCRTCGNCRAMAGRAVRVLDEQLRADAEQRIGRALESVWSGAAQY